MRVLNPRPVRLEVEGRKRKEKFTEIEPGTVLIAKQDIEGTPYRRGDEIEILGYCQTELGLYVYTPQGSRVSFNRIGATESPCHEVLFTDLPPFFGELDLMDYEGGFMVSSLRVKFLAPVKEDCKVIQLKLAL